MTAGLCVPDGTAWPGRCASIAAPRPAKKCVRMASRMHDGSSQAMMLPIWPARKLTSKGGRGARREKRLAIARVVLGEYNGRNDRTLRNPPTTETAQSSQTKTKPSQDML